jgi:hypothetical protein
MAPREINNPNLVPYLELSGGHFGTVELIIVGVLAAA